jgi:hypothetical protein
MITTVQEAIDRIREIESYAGDDEAQHGREDDLMREFIASVAAGMLDSQEAQTIANRIVQVNQMDFARWCA